MDERMTFYLNEMENLGILKESAVIFLSDHGLRFGPARHLLTGWLEERLPFIFISLPKWFKDKHPDIAESLTLNQERLSSTFDLHMALRSILKLAGSTKEMPPPLGCPTCRSLFEPLPLNRSCSDAGIIDHYCTCGFFKDIDPKEEIVNKTTHFAIDFINKKVSTHRTPDTNESLCATLTLKKFQIPEYLT